MQAYGYVRVSTGRQADSGLSLEAQRIKIKALSELHDFCLVRTIEDAGASGKTLDRPGMRALLSLIDKAEVDVVIVSKLDRITRSTADLTRLIERLRGARRADGGEGVDFISASEHLDTSTASGRLVINILGTVAMWEREVISERVTEALARKKKRGEAAGNTPYGFDKAEDGKLVSNDTEQKVLGELRALRAAGEKWVRITQNINGNGHRTRRGSVFSRQGLQQIAKTAGIE